MNTLILAISVIVLNCIIVEVSKKNDIMFRVCLLFVSIFYFFGVMYFTLLRSNRVGISGISIRIPLPFTKAIQNHSFGLAAQRSLLNILLFVPLGYLLPNIGLLFRRKLEWWQVVVFGFVTSLMIETTQLVLQRGVYELDDLIKNTLGAVIGHLLYWLFTYVFNDVKFEDNP